MNECGERSIAAALVVKKTTFYRKHSQIFPTCVGHSNSAKKAKRDGDCCGEMGALWMEREDECGWAEGLAEAATAPIQPQRWHQKSRGTHAFFPAVVGCQ